MGKLTAYLSENGIKQYEFAARVPTTPATVSRWLSGKATPSDDLKVRIERITNGAVPVGAWFERISASDEEAA